MLAAGEADAVHQRTDLRVCRRGALARCQVFHTRPGVTCASGVSKHRDRQEAGCSICSPTRTVNIDLRTSATLAEIAISAADFARRLDIEPKVAMLSFSISCECTCTLLSEKVRHPRSNRCASARPDIARIDGGNASRHRGRGRSDRVALDPVPVLPGQGCQRAGLPRSRFGQCRPQAAFAVGWRGDDRPDLAGHWRALFTFCRRATTSRTS